MEVTSILRCPTTKMELVFHNADDAKLLFKQIINGELIHLDGTYVKSGFDAFFAHD